MLIGVPKEIKSNEFRVGLVPSSVKELTHQGHRVMIETQAGAGIGFQDSDYEKVGGTIVNSPQQIFSEAEMIVKVKEPQVEECERLRPGQILFTYLHLAPDVIQTDLLLKSGCIAIAYETVTDAQGGLPLLSPMSEVAGRLSIQAGATSLEKIRGGRGILLGGVPGVAPAKVLVIGGGVVGTNAARMALGLGAEVILLERSLKRLKELDLYFGSKLRAIYATQHAIEEYSEMADLIIGAVLIAGATAPKLITRNMLKNMKPGTVLVDVAIDQGGCFETSKPTTHLEPTYEIDGILHYCVANMPAAVPRTSAIALNNATLPFVIALANKGYKAALLNDAHFLNGLNIYRGHLTCEAVAVAQNKPFIQPQEALNLL